MSRGTYTEQCYELLFLGQCGVCWRYEYLILCVVGAMHMSHVHFSCFLLSAILFCFVFSPYLHETISQLYYLDLQIDTPCHQISSQF